MAKMTKEEKKEKLNANKAAAKAKKAAKRAALIEKKRKQAEAKKAKREAKKAKRLAKLEKEKAKKAALKEKKRLAKEKKQALETAKKIKPTKTSNVKPTSEIDIKDAAKTMKLALAQIASQFALLDSDKRAKKAKSIGWMGYAVETIDGNVVAKFIAEKSKKTKLEEKVDVDDPSDEPKPEVKKVAVDTIEVEPSYPDGEQSENIEVPAGDIYGQDDTTTGEIANIEDDDESIDSDSIDSDGNEDETNDENDDDCIVDSRDEQDDDLVESRREFFSMAGEDGEFNEDC